jgi:sporulation protein YlmC with PRC-barrel domain
MRLTDLLDSEVRDPSGRSLGRVHEVRLVQDGPVVGASDATFRLAGLIVGRTKFGARLGFARSNVRGPWLVDRLFERLHADERLVPWEAVRAVSDEVIHVDVTSSDVQRPDPLP